MAKRRRQKRPASGRVVERPGKTGTSYAIWFRFNGKRVYRTVGRSQDGCKRADAERELQNVLADINRGHHAEPDEVTFHEFASEWLHRREPELKPSTHAEYKDMIELHLSPYFGDYLLSQITLEHVDAYKAAKLREQREVASAAAAGRPLMESYENKQGKVRQRKRRALAHYAINKTLTRLSQLMEDAVRYGYVQSNPARQAKRLRVSQPEVACLEPEQVVPLLEAMPDRYRPLFEVLVRAGLRIGEALGLKWADVDYARSVLHLRRTVYREHVHDTTKSGQSEVPVRMTPELAQALAAYQLTEHDEGRGGEDDWVFSAKHDARLSRTNKKPAEGMVVNGRTPLNPANIRNRVLRPAIKRANKKLTENELPTIAESLTLHDLRRSCCSLLFASGAALPEVMERMRHKDERTTLRIYAKAMRSREGEVDSALDALIGNKPATNGGREPDKSEASPQNPRSNAMGATGLEPVTSSLSSWRSPN